MTGQIYSIALPNSLMIDFNGYLVTQRKAEGYLKVSYWESPPGGTFTLPHHWSIA